MNNSEILIQEYINSLGSSNQWIIASRGHSTTIINAFSSDQFFAYRLIQEKHRKQCKEFQLRQIYALPNTPKIILVQNMIKQNDEILLLAQKGQFQFDKLITHYRAENKNQLELALQIFTIIQMLYKKYGYFKLTQKMIRASKGPSLLVWINQDQVNNHPQFPIGPFYPLNLQKGVNKYLSANSNKHKNQPLYIMIVTILQILIQKITHSATLHQLLKCEPVNLTFQYVKKTIGEALKDQTISQYTVSSVPSSQKLRRFTEQKRKKIPDFLLNKTNNDKRNRTNKAIDLNDTGNKKSMLTFTNNNSSYHESNIVSSIGIGGIKKMGVNTKTAMERKMLADKDRQLLNTILRNNQAMSNHISLSKQYIQINSETTQEFLRSTSPNKNQKFIQLQSYRKNQRHVVRDSGKTVSTSSNNYQSVNSSGKKFYQSNCLTDLEETFEKKNEKKDHKRKLTSTFGKYSSNKEAEQQRSVFFRQNITKMETKVSKIIQQNYEQKQTIPQIIPASNKTPRHPSIMNQIGNHNIMNNNSSMLTITQQSIVSPGSQFYKDVDILLHSGANVSRNLQQEFDKSIEGQLNKILFD